MKLSRKLLSICLSLCIFFMCMVGIIDPSAAAEETPASTTDDPVIIVSLGDSYSSGEGIEKFFGQDLPVNEKVQNSDWLAHRSENAWSGMLTSDGFTGTASEHRDVNWYFVAASGAKIKHLTNTQEKHYKYDGLESDAKNPPQLPAQLDIISNLGLTENDYITITMGGNDVGFVDILTTAIVEELIDKYPGLASNLESYFPDTIGGSKTLEELLTEKKAQFDDIKDSLKAAYSSIQSSAGNGNPAIIVAGYPTLFYENCDANNPYDPNDESKVAFTVSVQLGIINLSVDFHTKKAHEINEAVYEFNALIEAAVIECAKDGMNIHFVSVAGPEGPDSFIGHEAYSSNPFINGIILNADSNNKDQTIDGNLISSYSFHPNLEGAKVYATAVQAKINQIEAAKKEKSFSALQEIIDNAADGDTIRLDKDYTALSTDSYLRIPEGKTITIDLNGHTIDRNLKSAKPEGNVIYIRNNSTLTIKDSGTGGTITGGNTNGTGGGIYNNGKLILEGGCITGNNANLGGGIYNNGHLILESGSITGNNAASGGGIYNNGTLNLRTDNDPNPKPIVISGNSSGSPASNVYLPSGKTITADTSLIAGSQIGVTVEDAPTGVNPVTITNNCDQSTLYFESDNKGYVLVNDNGVAKLAVPVTVTFYKNDDSGTTTKQMVPGGIETTLISNPFTLEYHTFSGWTKEANGTSISYEDGKNILVTEDTKLYALWKKNTYLVKFENADGQELQSGMVEYGETPEYKGPTPTITPSAQYTYTFEKWDNDIVEVKGEATYTATYTSTTNMYTIKFVNDDGTELQASEVEYGITPVYSGENPTKAADVQYTYTFEKWDSDIVEVVGNATYKATYSKTTNKYKITFVNEDGTVLQSSDIAYDETPVYNGEKPTKAPDEQYTYTFDKWSPVIAKVAGNATYTATYTKTINKYKITFVNEDGTVLQSSEVEYGETPKYLGETPVKAPDDKYNYIFAKWSSEIVKVTGDATYTATFKQSTCRHIPEEKKIENKKDPTCTEEGSYDEVIYCETCKEELSRKTITEDPTGHNFGDWEVVKKPTLTEKGMEQRVCANDPTHIETREIDKLPKMVYKSTFATITWQKGNGKSLTWTIHRDEDDANCIKHYLLTLIDGKEVEVSTKSGSTIVTISADILEKLSVGAHTITVLFDDGEVTLPLTISASTTSPETTPSPDASPVTGDNSNPALWYLLTIGSLIGMAMFVRYGRKHAEE